MMNEGSTYEGDVSARNDISITKLRLRIPCESLNYKEFTKQNNHSEKEFKNTIKKHIKNNIFL